MGTVITLKNGEHETIICPEDDLLNLIDKFMGSEVADMCERFLKDYDDMIMENEEMHQFSKDAYQIFAECIKLVDDCIFLNKNDEIEEKLLRMREVLHRG